MQLSSVRHRRTRRVTSHCHDGRMLRDGARNARYNRGSETPESPVLPSTSVCKGFCGRRHSVRKMQVIGVHSASRSVHDGSEPAGSPSRPVRILVETWPVRLRQSNEALVIVGCRVNQMPITSSGTSLVFNGSAASASLIVSADSHPDNRRRLSAASCMENVKI